MRIRGKLIALFLASSLINSHLAYPREFNLKEAVDYSLEHNPNLIIARNKIKKSEVMLKDARKILNLNVSVQAGFNPLTQSKGIGFGVSQDLNRILGANKKEKELAFLELDSARQEFAIMEKQAIKEAVEAFNNLDNIKGSVNLKKEAFLDAAKILKFAQEKFDLGVISLDELLSKKKTFRESEFEFRQSQKDLKEAYLRFYQSIGYKEEIAKH